MIDKIFNSVAEQLIREPIRADMGMLMVALAIFHIAEKIGDAGEAIGNAIESGASTIANNFYRIR